MFPDNITREEARRRSGLLAVDSYAVTVDLSGRDRHGEQLAHPDRTFVTSATIAFRAHGAGHTHLDLLADEVFEATLDGEALDVGCFAEGRLPFEVREGTHEIAVTALFRYSRSGLGLHRFIDPADGRSYLYTQFEVAEARRMYPCFEQPDLKATFAFTVIAPSEWTVASNAAAVEPERGDDGFSTWRFAPTLPISTYITALVAGHYHRVVRTFEAAAGPIEMALLCRQSLVPYLDVDRILATTQAGFGVFEEQFGLPYPFGSYDQVFVPEYNMGAMENAGCVTFRDEYLYRSRVTRAAYEARDNTILHELAHMWFGDLVTMRWWDDLWLNESFAEWASHFAQAEISGRPEAAWAVFTNARKLWAYRQDQLPSTHPIAADMVDLEAVELNFDGITYAKGASALRQLVAFVGRDAFLEGVRHYFAAHAYGNTELGDLLVALEKSSGRDLSGWSAEWLETAGVNTLWADFETDEEGRFRRFAVVQSAAPARPTLRHHRIAIGIYGLDGEALVRRQRVEIDVAGATTEVPALVGVARGDLILLNDDDYTYAKIRFDDRSLATLAEHLSDLPSPLARSVCWGAVWDMCRDGEMPAADYVDLVLGAIARESDLTGVQRTLGQVQTAVNYYAPKEQRDDLLRRVESGFARLLKDAEPGSDHQLAFARALAGVVESPAGGDLIGGWLVGEEIPPGLVVDTDLRWFLIAELARIDRVSEQTIAKEEERDHTITGTERAAGARAARPHAESKAAAWGHAVDDPDVPNETQFQIVTRFHQFNQDEILLPYRDRYLQMCSDISDKRGVWERKGLSLQTNALTHLFPSPLADAAWLDELDAWLAATPLSDPVRRVVVERADDARRAVHAQERGAVHAQKRGAVHAQKRGAVHAQEAES